MTEQQFLNECERVLGAIETALDDSGEDVDTQRSGNVLEIELPGGSKIIVNGNAPVREIWVAARSGGFHFRHDAGRWLDTRSGEPLAKVLAGCFAHQAQMQVEFPGL